MVSYSPDYQPKPRTVFDVVAEAAREKALSFGLPESVADAEGLVARQRLAGVLEAAKHIVYVGGRPE